MEHSQGSLQKKKKNHTLLNGNFVLAGSVACNNRLQTIIFTIFVVLYFGVATEHDSFLKSWNRTISAFQKKKEITTDLVNAIQS